MNDMLRAALRCAIFYSSSMSVSICDMWVVITSVADTGKGRMHLSKLDVFFLDKHIECYDVLWIFKYGANRYMLAECKTLRSIETYTAGEILG